ncbi:MAG TPA: hypothetical protein VN688_31630 [Gemmataceae bacterium]|nr:hypothetical protein [Gemmataceae bacterium]
MEDCGRKISRLLASLVLAALGAGQARTAELPPPPTVAPALTAAPSLPAPPLKPAVLRPGDAVTLRVLQVIPPDGLSPAERLLNGRNPILPGDHFLAEVIAPVSDGTTLVGGVVTKVTRPGWFGHSGYVTLQLAQFVQSPDGEGRTLPWRVNTEDRQLATRMRRTMVRVLLGLEGIGAGASMGAQMSEGNVVWTTGGAGVGLLVGLAYSSFQRGSEASLEPGDTFCIVVGSMAYRPVSREWQTILHPAPTPGSGKRKGK